MDLAKGPRAGHIRSGYRISSLIRRVLILTPIDRETSVSVTRVNNEVYDAHFAIQSAVDRAVETLQELTGRHVPPIRLDFRKLNTKNVPIAGLLPKLHRVDQLRVVIPLTDVPSSGVAASSPSRNGMTHLVAVQPPHAKPGWHSAAEPFDAVIDTPRRNIVAAVIDIALDIAMSHTFETLLQDRGLFGPTLSGKKVAFAVAHRLSTYYGDLDPSAGYVSLAAIARDGFELSRRDLQRYVDLWAQFLGWSIVPRPVPRSTRTASQIVESLLAAHRRGGQLRRRRLEGEISKLPAGTYVLVVAERRPTNGGIFKRILTRLHRKSWKTNVFVIVPFDERSQYVDLIPFVSLAPFDVERKGHGDE